MKNIKIFPKDWLQIHPYKQSTPIDSYYTSIANRIYDIMEQTQLVNSFEGDEVKQICIRLAAYFEDVISELGIWRNFILYFKKTYGKYLPFYTPDDHYYDDEVNYEDVRFLLWHFTQQYHGFRKGTFVSPDNPVNESTSILIYNMFCDEWTTAPENARMKVLFEDETRYENQDDYEQLLFWFHYNSYLLTDTNMELSEYSKMLVQQSNGNKEQLDNQIMAAFQQFAYVSKTALLALTSPELLSMILPETHPDHAFFVEIADKSKAFIPEDVVKTNKENYEKFVKAADGKLILYFDNIPDVKTFLTKTTDIVPEDKFELPKDWKGDQLAVYGTEKEGVQVMNADLNLIKDENNPFYNADQAARQALSYFIVKHCSVDLLKQMMEKGMLADAQTKSLTSAERGKAIIQDNWEFLTRYFIREIPKAD